MNKILQEIISHYNQLNKTQKLVKTTSIQNHEFNIDQKYQIIDKIGKGQFSLIVAALIKKQHKSPEDQVQQLKDKQKNQQTQLVAIKKINKAFQNLVFARKALRQLRAFRLLKHPNIIKLYTIQLPPSRFQFNELYCIYQMMDVSLQTMIHSDQEMTEQHWKFFLYQILRALKFIHSSGIIHGNISSKACLINDVCDLKISTLSQITLLSHENRSQTIHKEFKILVYPAPQILLKKKNYGCEIDIWSLACVFGEMINRKPFIYKGSHMLELYCDYIGNPSGQDLKDIPNESLQIVQKLIKHKREPKNLSKIFPLVSDKGIDLLEKMLVFNQKKRISAAQALKHPYFEKLHCEQFEPVREEIDELEFEFQKHQLNAEEYKDILFQQILLYHSKPLKQEYKKKLKRKQSLMDHILNKQSRPQTLSEYIDSLMSNGIKQLNGVKRTFSNI